MRIRNQEVTAHITRVLLLVSEKGSVSSAAESSKWIISLL